MRQLGQIAAIGLVAMASMASIAFSEECKLEALPIKLVPNDRGRILMAFEMDGKPATFMLDTGAFWGLINRKWVGDHPIHSSPVEGKGMGGRRSDEFTTISSLSVNHMKFPQQDMLVAPDGLLDDDIAGVFGANYLQNFDIEINLAENKLNLFLPFKCDGNPVYWTKDVFAEIPIEENREKHIFVKVLIDGKRVRTVLDTGAPTSFLTASAAEDLFGLKPGDAGMEQFASLKNHDGSLEPVYRHRFSTLEMDGLVFRDPWITVSKNTLGGIIRFDLIMGVHQLRDLHLYISYKKHRMYVTKASATPVDNLVDETASSRAPPASPVLDHLDKQLMQPDLDRAAAAARDKRPDLAKAALDDLVAHFPTYPQVYFYRASFAYSVKDYAGAAADLDHAIAMFPSYADAYRLRSKVRHEQQDEAGAEADSDSAIKFEPNAAATYLNRADLLGKFGDYDGAVKDLTSAILLDPKLVNAYLARGEILALQSDYQQALGDFQQAVALDPKNADAIDDRGKALFRLGRRDEALASFSDAIELAPKAPGYLNNRCWHLALVERFDEALGDCNRAVELAPKNPSILDSRAYVFLHLNRPKEAVADFDAALVANPKSAHSMYGRGLAKQQIGDAKGAKADLAAALQLQPDIAQHFSE